MKPIQWNGSCIIRAPRDKVYECATDFDRWSELMPGIVKSLSVDSRSETEVLLMGVFNILGRQWNGLMTIRPLRNIGYDSKNTSARLGQENESVRLEDVAKGTLYKWNVEVKPAGTLIKILGRFLQPLIRRFCERTIIDPIRREVE